MRDELFTVGVDTGAFLVKAHVKIPISEFRSPILQSVVDKLVEKYTDAIDHVMEDVETRLKSSKAAKALRLVVFEEDELRKAEGKDGHEKDGGYTKVSHPGARGGKFWIDQKGHVRYDERPGGRAPSPKHREATDEEVSDYIKKQVTPTLFVGHDDDTMHAIMKSKVFDDSDMQYIEWFRSQVLNTPEVLGEMEGVHDLDDIDARNFSSSSGTSGAKGVMEWLEEWWVSNIRDEDLFGGDKSQVPTMAQAKEWFYDLMKKYSEATKDPKVKAALKENFIRLQRQADTVDDDIQKTLDVSNKVSNALFSPQNSEDGALTGMALMKGMNLLFMPSSGKELARGSSGKVNKRMKGQIHVNEVTLDALRSGKLNLVKSGASEAQAMLFVVAGHLSENKDQDTGKYGDKSFRTTNNELLSDLTDYKFGRKFLDLAQERQGHALSEGEKKHYAQRIAELGEHIAMVMNDQHDGQAPGVEEIMQANTTKLLEKDDAITAIRDKIDDNLRNSQELLDAQEDGQWKMPSSGPLAKGKYGGEGKNPKSLPPHQINPQTGQPWGMFTHQKQAINWMEVAKRGILAHGAGLGKTTEAVAFIEHMKAKGSLKRGIFFLPPALIPQWVSEIESYAPGNTILDLSRFPAADREAILKSDLAKEASYILVSKGTLTGGDDDEGPKEEVANDGFHEALSNIEDAALFVDEVHQGGFKDPDNSAYKVTNKVLTGREYAFGMTATPLPNAPQDLFHLSNLFAPGTLGKFSTWQGRLADAQWNPEANGGVGGYEVANFSDLKDLNERAKSRVFVKKFDDPDVAKELAKAMPAAPKPETNKVFLSSKSGSNGLSQLDYVHHGIPKMVDVRLQEIEEEREKAGLDPLANSGMVAKLLTLNLQRQATISPELIDPKYKGPAPKIDDCVNHIINHFSPGGGNSKGKGIAVFCNFKKAFPILKRALAEKGIDPSIIGEIHSDSEHGRGATQDAFNGTEKDGKFESKVKIMLVGIKAGGAGLNLQKGGNAAYFLDEPFTASDKEQCIGRVFRIGQKDPVKLTTVMAHGSYDERMNAMIASKNAIAQALLVRDPSKVNQVLTNTSALLGVEVPAPPKPEVLKKFEEMAHLVQMRADDVNEMWDSIQDDDGGTLQDNEIVVNPKAKNSLPPHLRHTHDMKEYERERRQKMEMDNALMYAKNDRLVGERFLKDGQKDKAKKYIDRAERLERMVSGVKESAKAPKTSTKEAAEKVKEITEDLPKKFSQDDAVVVVPHKKNPYNAGSKKKVDPSRDQALGVKDKDDHMTHEQMDFFYNEFRKKKPASMKEFISTVLKPAYAGTGITAAQLKETAQQVLHHLKSDGLIDHA